MNRLIAIAALIVLAAPPTASAQTAQSQLAPLNESPLKPLQPPPSSGPFATGNLAHAVGGSGSVVQRALNKVSFEPTTEQIRFDVHVLQVDTEVRDAIYQRIADHDVNTEITQIESTVSPEADAAALASVHRIASGSIVTTAVMSQADAYQLIAMVNESESSDITARPTMIVAEGQVGAIQQQVQRPFLSKLEEVEVGGQSSVRSDIHVLNEGFDFAVQAQTEGDTLLVRTKLQHSRVVDVKAHHVYGIGKGRKTVQVPSHEVRIAAASEKLKAGQTLLLDPYLETERSVKPATTPVIGQFLPSAKANHSASQHLGAVDRIEDTAGPTKLRDDEATTPEGGDR